MTADELITFVTHRGKPLSEAALKKFEKEIGAELPADYRAFLQLCNGGFLGGRFWYKPPRKKEKGWKEGPYGTEAGLHHLYGLRPDDDTFDFHDTLEAYDFGTDQPRMPREVIPIADDPFGNGICLVIKGPRRGEIVFWDHENEPDPDEWDGSLETAENVSRVCASFTVLVERLEKTSDDEEDEEYKEEERVAAGIKAKLAALPAITRPALYDRLVEFRDELAKSYKGGDPFDCPAIGLMLLPRDGVVRVGTQKVKRHPYPAEPSNTDPFALYRDPVGHSTVVFGFLRAEGVKADDPPVTAAFPGSNQAPSWGAMVIAENLHEFLCLGSRIGYAALGDLHRVPPGRGDAEAGPSPEALKEMFKEAGFPKFMSGMLSKLPLGTSPRPKGPTRAEVIQRLETVSDFPSTKDGGDRLKRLAAQFDLTPWRHVAKRFKELDKKYFELLIWADLPDATIMRGRAD